MFILLKKHAWRKCCVLRHMHSIIEAVYLNFMKLKLLSNLYFMKLYFLLTSNKNQRCQNHVSWKKKTKQKNGRIFRPLVQFFKFSIKVQCSHNHIFKISNFVFVICKNFKKKNGILLTQ